MTGLLKITRPSPSPPEHVVEKLRELLRRAEAGEIDSLAYVTVAPDGELRTGSVWETHWWLLLAGASHLVWRMNLSSMDGDDTTIG